MNPRTIPRGGVLVAVPLALFLALLTGCNDNSKNATAHTRTPATAPLDYLAAQGAAKKHSERVISTVQIQQAIQQFNAMEERLPKDLDELVAQHYLGAKPVAPRGQQFQYDPRTGTVRLVAAQ